jgi:hypothetical protein
MSGNPPPGLIGREISFGGRNVVVSRFLGEGGFSFVFIATGQGDGVEYVLKRMVAQTEDNLAMVQKEVRLMATLRHENLVRFVGSCSGVVAQGREVFVLMEFCRDGHLLDVMRRMGDARFSEPELLRIFGEVTDALAVLHAQDPPIAHRDLKLENVLRTGGGVHRLCDLGSCVQGAVPLATKQQRNDAEEVVEKTTTQMYRAPEMVDLYAAPQLDERVDIWALGCMLCFMAFWKHPFQDAGNLAIINAQYKLPQPRGAGAGAGGAVGEAPSPYSAGLHDVIGRMLRVNPALRADLAEVRACLAALASGGGQAALPAQPAARVAADEAAARKKGEPKRKLLSGRPKKNAASSGSAADSGVSQAERLRLRAEARKRESAPVGRASAGAVRPSRPSAPTPAPAPAAAPATASFASFDAFGNDGFGAQPAAASDGFGDAFGGAADADFDAFGSGGGGGGGGAAADDGFGSFDAFGSSAPAPASGGGGGFDGGSDGFDAFGDSSSTAPAAAAAASDGFDAFGSAPVVAAGDGGFDAFGVTAAAVPPASAAPTTSSFDAFVNDGAPAAAAAPAAAPAAAAGAPPLPPRRAAAGDDAGGVDLLGGFGAALAPAAPPPMNRAASQPAAAAVMDLLGGFDSPAAAAAAAPTPQQAVMSQFQSCPGFSQQGQQGRGGGGAAAAGGDGMGMQSRQAGMLSVSDAFGGMSLTPMQAAQQQQQRQQQMMAMQQHQPRQQQQQQQQQQQRQAGGGGDAFSGLSGW